LGEALHGARRTAARLALAVVIMSTGHSAGIGRAATPAFAAGAHPRLLLSASDLPALRTKVASGQPKLAWTYLKKKADAYVGPGQYQVMPERITLPGSTAYQAQNEMPTYLIDLAMAYAISGDTRYSTLVNALLDKLADAGWPSWSAQNQLGMGDLMRGVALAFDIVYSQLTPLVRTKVVSSLAASLPTVSPSGQVLGRGVEGKAFNCIDEDWEAASRVGNNWHGVCGGGQGMALLAIDGEPGVKNLAPYLSVAKARVQSYAAAMYSAQGDNQEGLLYSAYGDHNALPFAFAWKRQTGVDLLAPTPGVAEHVVNMAYEQIPGEPFRFADRNDSVLFGGIIDEQLSLLPGLRTDGAADWLWDNTVGPSGEDILGSHSSSYAGPNNMGSDEGAPCDSICYRSSEAFTILYYADPVARPRVAPGSLPTPVGPVRHYERNGLVDIRTAFGPAAANVMMTYEAKRNYVRGHAQHDMGQFTLYGYGERFAIDSGYGRDHSCTDAQEVYKGCNASNSTTTAGRAGGHNVVLLDNDPLTQDGGRLASTYQSIPLVVDAPAITLIRSDLKQAYSAIGRAGRNVLFLRAPGEPVVIVVTDAIRTGASNNVTYDWQLHTSPDNTVSLDGAGFTLDTPSGATLVGAVAAPQPRRIVPSVFSGSGSGTHPVLESSDAALDTMVMLDHLAVLSLTRAGATPRPLTVEPATGGSIISTPFAVIGSKAVVNRTLVGAHLVTDGDLAKLSVGRGETVLLNGTSLVSDERSYVSVTGAPATVVVSGSSVIVEGSTAGNTYSVYAPQEIGTVTINGTVVGATRSGDYLTF
jgi:hypothetical protein